jgi:hypothetical protein
VSDQGLGGTIGLSPGCGATGTITGIGLAVGLSAAFAAVSTSV